MRTRSIVALLSSVLWVAGAQAFTFTADSVSFTPADIGDSFEVDWLVDLPDVDLTATATFTLTAFDSDNIDFDIVLENTTPTNVVINGNSTNTVRISSFGFNIQPDATGVTVTQNAADWSADVNQNFPGWQSVDVCAWDGNNCSGGGNEGVFAGASDSLSLSLTGTFGNETAMLLDFPAKFQGDFGSFEPGGTPHNGGGNGGGGGGGVPEPGSLSLILLGAFGLMRRRRSTSA